MNKAIICDKLILGTVQFGLNYGINNSEGKVSLNNSLKILEYAYDHGVRTLDSAEVYGNAHDVIGIFHDKNPTKIFNIITKLPKLINYDILDKTNGYLRDLKVKHLETLMFHSFDSYKNNIKNFDVLKELKSNNKIMSLGVSVYTNTEVEKVLLNKDIDIIQLPFNLFDNASLRGDILQKAKISGKTIHTRSALLQGIFFKNPSEKNIIVSKLRKELEEIHKISLDNNISISNMALSYVFNKPYIDNIVIGVDSLLQLKQNLKSINFKMNEDVINSINDIKIKNKEFLNPVAWSKY